MNYEETLEYLFAQLPMYQRIGAAAYKTDLRNTHRLSSLCGSPEDGLRCVHVAGTNGKGSTCHALASVFQACGYRTGLMTSPHYLDFRERIKVDGEMIAQDFVVDFVHRFKSGFEKIEASFFELTVIMGFAYFQKMKVDIAIIETGMGGRLDSTNVVSPDLSIITPIGMDHQAFLGDTLAKIAREKAGIIKRRTPVLISEGNEELLSVFSEVAERLDAPLHLSKPSADIIDSDLKGPYQAQNLNTAASAIDILKDLGYALPAAQVDKGFKNVILNTGFVGRWQWISKEPRILADAAHNEAGLKVLFQGISEIKYARLHIVLAMVSDKDVDKVLSYFPKAACYYFSQAKVLRAMPKESLAEKAKEHGLDGGLHSDIPSALAAAKSQAGRDDLILVCGSIFTVAEVIPR